jgi:membrane protease YdiL (CAAX protease family)
VVAFLSERDFAKLWHALTLARRGDFSFFIVTDLSAGIASFMLSEKPWKPEAVLRLGMGVLVCVFGGALTVSLVRRYVGDHFDNSPWRIVIGALSFQVAALVLVHRFLLEHKIRWRDAFGLGNNWKRAVLGGTIFAVLFLPIGLGLQLITATLLLRFHIQPGEQPAVRALREIESAADIAALACVAVLLAPLAEELLFRGILYPAIKRIGFRRLALWGSSLLFAAIHLNFLTFVPLLLLSLGLTLLYENTDNLLAPITAHAFFNTLNFVMFFSGEMLHRLLSPQQ